MYNLFSSVSSVIISKSHEGMNFIEKSSGQSEDLNVFVYNEMYTMCIKKTEKG